MNRSDLRKVMNRFTVKSNSLLKTDFVEYNNALKKYISFLESEKLINDFICSCGGYNEDIKNDVDEVVKMNCIFSLGETDADEVQIVYSVLKCITINYDSFPYGMLMSYSSESKWNDKLKEFNNRFVIVLINQIESYLKEIGIDMGLDEKITYNITGTQVNIANDNATINATQNNNGLNADELSKLISEMRNSLSEGLSDEDRKDAEESIEVIGSELASGNPNEETVKTRFKLLSKIDTGIKFANACCGLLTFADKLFPFLADVVPFYQNLIK